MPEIKVIVMDLRIKRKYKNSSKMAKTLAVSKGKVYRVLACSLELKKAGFPHYA